MPVDPLGILKPQKGNTVVADDSIDPLGILKKKSGTNTGGTSPSISSNPFADTINKYNTQHQNEQPNPSNLGVDIGMKPVNTEAIKAQHQKTVQNAASNTLKRIYKENIPSDSDNIKNNLIEGVNNGSLGIVKDASGNDVIKNSGNFFQSFKAASDQAYAQAIEDKYLKNSSKDEAISYLNRIQQHPETGIVKESDIAPNGIGELLGSQSQILGKATIGSLAGAETGLTGGASAGSFLGIAKDIANSGYSQALKKNYNILKQQGLDDSEAFDKATKAALVGEAVGLGTGALLSGEVKMLPRPTVSTEGFINSLKHTALSAPKVLGSTAAGAVANDVATNSIAHGNPIDKKQILSDVEESVKPMAVMHFALGGLAAVANRQKSIVPSYARPQMENIVASADRNEVQNYLQTQESKGELPEGTTAKVLNTLQKFDEKKAVVAPFRISEESKAAIAGKLVQKDALLEQKSALKPNENALPQRISEIDKQIAGIDGEINKLYGAKNPYEKETDAITGESSIQPKAFEELKPQEKDGIVVPKEYGTADVVEKGEGENKTYVPKANFIEKNGALEIKKNIPIESETFPDRSKAQAAADNALKQHYYENGLHDNAKPDKKIEADTQTEIPISKANEGTATDNEQSSQPSIETSKTEKGVGEVIQEQQALNADKHGDVYTTKQPAMWDAQLNYERGKKSPKYVYLTIVDNPSKEASAYGHETASPPSEVKVVKNLGELDKFRDNEDAPLSAGEFEAIRKEYSKQNNIPLENVEFHLSNSDKLTENANVGNTKSGTGTRDNGVGETDKSTPTVSEGQAENNSGNSKRTSIAPAETQPIINSNGEQRVKDNSVVNSGVNNSNEHTELDKYIKSKLGNDVGIEDLPIGVENWTDKELKNYPITKTYFDFKKETGNAPKIEKTKSDNSVVNKEVDRISNHIENVIDNLPDDKTGFTMHFDKSGYQTELRKEDGKYNLYLTNWTGAKDLPKLSKLKLSKPIETFNTAKEAVEYAAKEQPSILDNVNKKQTDNSVVEDKPKNNLTSQNGNKETINKGQNKSDANNIQPLDEKSIKEKLSNIDQSEITEPYDKVLSYFSGDGKIHSSAIQELYGNKRGKSVESERRSRINLLGKYAPSIDALAHKLWESDATGRFDTRDYKDAIEQVLLDHNSKHKMAKELVEKYDHDAAYQKYLAQHGNEFASIYDNLSDEDVNHILQLDADENKRKELENYIDNLKNNQDALQEQSPSSVLQHTQETVGETGSGRGRVESSQQRDETAGTQKEEKTIVNKDESIPLKPPPTEFEDLIHAEHPQAVLTHRGLQQGATEFGLENVNSRERKTDIQFRKDVENKIAEWKEKGTYSENINALLDDAALGKINETEQGILEQHQANLYEQARKVRQEKGINSHDYEKVFNELDKFTKVGQEVRSEAGAALRQKSFGSIPDESLEGYLLREKDSHNGAELTEKQKDDAQEQWQKLNDAKIEFEKYKEQVLADIAKSNAEKEFKAKKDTTKPTAKKSHDDFVKERISLKEQLAEAKKKHLDNLKAQGIQQAGASPIVLTADMVKIIKKMVDSYIDEGVQTLKEVVSKVYEDAKESIDDITEKHIHDIIAGVYNESKGTKNETIALKRDLQTEAALINRLEKLKNGEIPKDEKQKQQRNAEIAELQKKIGEHDITKLETLRKRNEATLKKVNEKLDKGDFEPESKKPSILLDDELRKRNPELYKKALESRDKLIKQRKEIEVRRLKNQVAKQPKVLTVANQVANVANVLRAIMSSADFSAPLRQGIWGVTSQLMRLPIGENAGFKSQKMLANQFNYMFRAAGSQKFFDRWFFDIAENPRFHLAEETKLAITDPHDPVLSAHEEAYMTNLVERIPLVGKTLIKGSERAYVMFLNKMRWDMFNSMADAYVDNGKTYQNSPELYKATAKYVNAATGRGDMGKALNSAAPILNATFFSPRLIASRVGMLTHTLTYALPSVEKTASLFKAGEKPLLDYNDIPKEIRVQHYKDLARFIGLIGTIVGGASLYSHVTGDKDVSVETDPRSSDFMKIKNGNTRFDLWGGFQQYGILASRLFAGQSKSSNTGQVQELNGQGLFDKTRADVLSGFVRGKTSPTVSMFWDYAAGRTIDGQPATLSKELTDHLMPLLYSDVRDAYKDRGVSGLFETLPASTFGVGIQTYLPRGYDDIDLNNPVYKTLYKSNINLNVPEQYSIKHEDGSVVSDREYKLFTQKREKYFQDEAKDVIKNGVYLNDKGEPTSDETKADIDEQGNDIVKPFDKLTQQQKIDIIKIISGNATRNTKKEMFTSQN